MKKPFLYFDLGNVVFDFSQSILELSKILRVSYIDILEMFREHDRYTCKGQLHPDELLRMYENKTGVSSGIDDFVLWWTSFFKPIIETHEFIIEAKKYNVQIGVISNIYPNVYPKLLKFGLIPDVSYDAVVLSCDIGFTKPEKDIFHLAQKSANSEDIIFVDDCIENIEMARTLNWDARQFHPKNNVLNKLKEELF